MARMKCVLAGAVVVVSCFFVSAHAEELLPPDIAFSQSYCDVANERVQFFIPTNEGFVVGVDAYREGSEPGTTVVKHLLVEAGSDGQVIAEHEFGNGLGGITSGQAVADGGYVLTYASDDWLSSGLVKVNAQGAERWRQSYQPSFYYFAEKVDVLNDGSYMVFGEEAIGPTYEENGILLLKADSSGGVVWVKSCYQGRRIEFWDICKVPPTADGPAGYFVLVRKEYGDPALLRVDENGDVVWQNDSYSSYPEWVADYRSIITVPDGIVVAGAALQPILGESRYNVALAKLNFAGEVVWRERYNFDQNPNNNENADAVMSLPDGGFLMLCKLFGVNFTLVRTDVEGNVVWERGYSGFSGGIYARAMALANDGGVLIAATMITGDYPNTVTDALVIKTTPIIPPIAIMFRRGDSNGDVGVDLSDAVNILFFKFLGEGKILCEDAADANDDGEIDVSDAVTILGCLFLGNPVMLKPPYPGTGLDPTDDLLGCSSYVVE